MRWFDGGTAMGFGKRATGSVAVRRPAAAAPRRRMVTITLAGLLISLGATTTATMGRASERGLLNDLFESIFALKSPPPVPVARPIPQAPRRYASLPEAHRSGGNRLVQRTPRLDGRALPRRLSANGASPAAFATGTRTVCVRRCDGYLFPVGRLRARVDLPVHAAACAAACPGASTDLFTLAPGKSELDQAVALDGGAYRRSASANLYRRTRVENCSCQPPGTTASLMPLADDRTLRPGDVIGSEAGADLVASLSMTGPRLVDYRIATVSRQHRDAIENRVGALRRDADYAAFREGLQTTRAGTRRLRLVEARSMRLRVDAASAGFAPIVSRGETFAPVRVVSPSPFGH